MRNARLAALALLTLSLTGGFAHAVELEMIGPGSGFQDVSANGATVLLFEGGSGFAYLWTAENGLTFIGQSDSNSPIYEISGDGKTVVGSMEVDGLKQAVIWTEADGWQGLGGSVTGCILGNDQSSGWGISGDGSVAVGLAWSLVGTQCKARAFRWSEETGMVLLETSNDKNSRASAVSADGQVAVGWTEAPFGTWRPTLWHADGSEQVLVEEPVEFSSAVHVNADGSVVVGELEKHAFRWTEAGGFQDLGFVPGIPSTLSRAVGVSADGNTIVGWGGIPPINLNGFVWTPAAGMRNLNDIVADAGINLGNRFISHATAVSADGKTIVGAILDPSTFTYEAYRLTLGAPEVPPIPNGADPAEGAPLLLDKLPNGVLRLSWSPTCLLTETDYGVYTGTLGNFASHTKTLCGTGSATEATILSSPGDAYYLVVPYNGDHEASYGLDSAGDERPVGTQTCAPETTRGSCQ